MIPARPGWRAEFKDGHHLPIIGWDEEGRPLVIHVDSGDHKFLRPATSYHGFTGVGRDEAYIHIIPGGGWMVRYEQPSGEAEVISPVVAWGFDAEGFGYPLVVEGSIASRAWAENAELFHPGEVG